MQLYTIDFGCERTKAAFTEDEWKEMEELNDFQLPKLPDSTEIYLLDVREALIKGQHVASVPVPSEDRYSCELVLTTFLSCLKELDESSTEDDVTPFKKLHDIASQRLQELSHARFRKEARFFSIYSRGLDFKTLEMRACPFSSRIMLFREYDWHELPATPRTWRRHVQGLTHLLQVRSCVTATVKMYDEILSKEETDDDSGEGRSGREWLYKPSTTRVYDDTLGSSPSGPSSSIFYS
ncbi:hypothetical protein DFQ27_003602 [Actinomortierella ambigua]|uniref:Uncharacterized protein n=1 Tax=Actinomortierella ambigua TaxID=1343610 RepID=A0A9P6Q7M2_9FUNG|nr:hypothetical protein DFQ27_003602 [Actinomortierella ambigua]